MNHRFSGAQFYLVSSMGIELGHITALFRYPVKSMAGVRLESAQIGWHCLEGDRRLAFRRLADRGAFPWLTASRLPELLLYQPIGRKDTTGEPLPTHIRTPDGKGYSLTDQPLLEGIASTTLRVSIQWTPTRRRSAEHR